MKGRPARDRPGSASAPVPAPSGPKQGAGAAPAETPDSAQPGILELSHRVAQLEAALSMRSHLLSNISHGIRTPLASIRGYMRMVLDGRAGTLPEQQRTYLQVVAENTTRLVEMADWMSRLSEAGPDELELTPVDLRQLWRQSVDIHAKTLAHRSIGIDEQFSDASFPAFADQDKLQWAFDRILGTAIAAASPEARLRVEFSRPRDGGATVKLYGMTAALPEISCGNPGGIPARERQTDGRAWDVQDIIGLHGGRLFVMTTSEQGPMFCFTLPAPRQAAGRMPGRHGVEAGPDAANEPKQ